MADGSVAQGEPTLHSLDKRLTSHEKVCAERQGTIIKRLARIEGIFLAAFGILALSQWQKIEAALAALRHP